MVTPISATDPVASTSTAQDPGYDGLALTALTSSGRGKHIPMMSVPADKDKDKTLTAHTSSDVSSPASTLHASALYHSSVSTRGNEMSENDDQVPPPLPEVTKMPIVTSTIIPLPVVTDPAAPGDSLQVTESDIPIL